MYTGIVVINNHGPCFVPRKLYKEILDKRQAGEFGHAILFMFEADLDRVSLNVTHGKMESVKTLDEFVNRFFPGGASGRSILIE